MTPFAISRRALLQQGSAAVAGLSVLRVAGPTAAFQTPVAGEVIPWLDQPEPNPAPSAAPVAPSVLNNSRGAPIVLTNASRKTGLRNMFA